MLFIVLYKVVLIFESVDEIQKCDRSNERYRGVLSYFLFSYFFLRLCVVEFGDFVSISQVWRS